MAVGPGETDKSGSTIPLTIKVDDLVVVLAEAGEPMKFAGEGIYMVSSLDVVAIIDESE